jgi:hypothetical protein
MIAGRVTAGKSRGITDGEQMITFAPCFAKLNVAARPMPEPSAGDNDNLIVQCAHKVSSLQLSGQEKRC